MQPGGMPLNRPRSADLHGELAVQCCQFTLLHDSAQVLSRLRDPVAVLKDVTSHFLEYDALRDGDREGTSMTLRQAAPTALLDGDNGYQPTKEGQLTHAER